MLLFSSCRISLLNTNFHRYFFQWPRLMNLKNSSTRNSNVAYPVKKVISQKIRATGPITIADFMKEATVNPISGYYTTRDVFGKSGDFVTAPEISQIFGELIAIWFVDQWLKVGAPKPFNIVELGPGRGSMMSDILRIFHRLKVDKELTVHMIEVSEVLIDIQIKKLDVYVEDYSPCKSYYKKGRTKNDVPVYWYKGFFDAQVEGFTFLVAQEFFDALPIHKFQKTADGWREVMIDLDRKAESPDTFRYVLSPGPTPMTKILINENETRDEFEACPDGLAIMEVLADRMVRYGGFSLIIDYGHDGAKTDTFRAFQKHAQCDPLMYIGEVDLTADVDFAALKRITGEKLISFGPITQKQFLKQMHIDVRLEGLIKNASEKEKENLQFGYHMLVDDDKMGTRYKVAAFFPSVLRNLLKKYPPVGFLENK